MNRGQLREELSFLLNFNEGQADQDFSTTRLNKAIQWAYEDEVRQAKLEGQTRWFRKVKTFIWAADDIRMELPQGLHKKMLQQLWDITSNDPGTPIIVRENGYSGGDIFWYDNKQLQWGENGPNSDVTIQADYLAECEQLTDDGDEPDLIPNEYHKLIVWSAAVFLRTVADEAPPASWQRELQMLRLGFWKVLSRGRPFTDSATVSQTDNFSSDIYI